MIDYNINELEQKGLFENGKPNEKYNTIYKKYKLLLDSFLNSKLNIKSFDEELQKSNLDFRKIDSEEKDFYQSNSSLDSSFVYLRNNLYLDKLSNEDLDKVYSLNEEDIKSLNDELVNFMLKTYKDVICGGEGFISYGPNSEDYWKPSNSIVFGFRYNEYPEDVDDEVFDDYNYSQIQFLSSFLDNKSKEYSSILGEKVEFIWYNEFTVDRDREETL